MVVDGDRGIIGELITMVELSGNHEGDAVVEVDVRVYVEVDVAVLLLERG